MLRGSVEKEPLGHRGNRLLGAVNLAHVCERHRLQPCAPRLPARDGVAASAITKLEGVTKRCGEVSLVKGRVSGLVTHAGQALSVGDALQAIDGLLG